MKKWRLLPVILAISISCTTSFTRAKDLDLPDIGDSGAALMTAAQEQRVGEAVMHNLRRSGLIVDDPILTEYINHLGYQLLSQRENPEQTKFTFFLVNDKTINAFALPGGFIGINYGLVMASESESELASVLAHEIAHVTQRHYARAYDVGSATELPILAAIIAAIVLGASGNADIGQAAIASIAGATIQREINFTRHNEEEADRVGIQLLAKAGYDAEKMASFFEKLDNEARLYGIDIPEFLRTHPVNTSRISDARNRAHVLPPVKPRDDLTYLLMRYRIVALSNPDKQASEKKFLEDLKQAQGNQQTALRYGYMLSLIRLEKFKQAQTEVEALLKKDPHRIAFLLAKAEIEVHAGQMHQAIKTYENALRIYPANKSLTYDYVNALMQQGEYKKADQVLSTFLKTPPENPSFYQNLARVKTKTGELANAHEAMAMYYHQIGQLHQAIDQINLALKVKDLDFYTVSRLEAQLAQIKEEIPKQEK